MSEPIRWLDTARGEAILSVALAPQTVRSTFGDSQPLTPMEVHRGAEPIDVN